MNRLTRLGAGSVFGACCLLLAGQAWAVPTCTDRQFLYREDLPESVTRVVDDATRDIGALAYGQAEQKLRLALDEQAPGSPSRVWFYDALGAMYLLQKRYADAEQAYRSALALDLALGLRHAVKIKLAGALFMSGKDDELISLVEAIERDECAPVRAQARYWLAAAYAIKGRLVDAERVVPKEGKDFALASVAGQEEEPDAHRSYRMLYWRVACALGRVGECARMLATQVPLMEASPEKTEWCDKQVASLARAPEAAAGLQDARAKGAIDSENRCVLVKLPPAAPYDEVIPLARTPPDYPRDALRRGITGTVVAEVTVAPNGSVSKVTILDSWPDGFFDSVAKKALRKWRFKPKVVDGVAVESKGIQRLDFQIGR